MSAPQPNPEGPVEIDIVADTERRLLRVLCGESEETEKREIARRGLASYRWREPVHQAIFEVVINFPSAGSQTLREQLPARLTRRGFPDFDFESLFDSPRLAPGEVRQLIRELRSGT